MNPRKMKQMMKQMGIDVEDIDAERVVIETADGDLVFDGAQVTKMDAQGQETYQIVGSPNQVDDAGVSGGDAADPALDEGDEDAGDDEGIPEEDIALVAQQAGVSKADAREALEAANGEPARAISNLQ
ncbi:nascent polypeptide-associated complex protein [Halorubrum ejinorense]